MKNLLLRSFTGLIYVVVIVCSLIFGGYWAFPLLCGLFGLIGVIEFSRMGKGQTGTCWPALIVDIAGTLMFISAPIGFAVTAADDNTVGFLGIASALVLFVIVRLVLQLYLHATDSCLSLSHSLMGLLYIGLPLGLAALLFSMWGAPMVLAMFVMIWLNDTGAYIVGSTMGRRRLFERISPKKSWEGFFGGMAFAVGGAFLIKYCFGPYSTGMDVVQLCGMGVIVSIMATWGDLVESMLKRSANIKDSGNILPGHGGILDRIDSLLLVAPSLFCYMVIWMLIRLA